jgi:nucleotide-binding universal stress UspA family protein
MYTMLLPTDGSDFTRKTMKQAMSFASALSAKVIGLHVMPRFHMPRDEEDVLPPSEELKERVDEEHKAKAQAILASIEAAARTAGIGCECVVAINDRVYEEIVNTAVRRNCDLIVMASHGHAGMTASLLGSETAKVLTHTTLPVLVLH